MERSLVPLDSAGHEVAYLCYRFPGELVVVARNVDEKTQKTLFTTDECSLPKLCRSKAVLDKKRLVFTASSGLYVFDLETNNALFFPLKQIHQLLTLIPKHCTR